MSRPRHASRDDEEVRHPHLPAMPDELKAYIPYLLNQLTNRWNIEQNRALGEYGINSTVLRTLSVLNIHKTLTINEIASYALVEQSNASRTIDSMVAAGLVQRQIAETDLRRRDIALTQKGFLCESGVAERA
jgi:MarR family transcriptional regulator for hemolysin